MTVIFMGNTVTADIEKNKWVADSQSNMKLSFAAKDFYIEGTILILRNANVGGNRISRVAFAQKGENGDDFS